MAKRQAAGQETVVFVGLPGVALREGRIGEGLIPGAINVFERPLDDVKAEWAKVTNHIAQMLEVTEAHAPQGLKLDSVEVGLTFTAKGTLAFIAEAGVQASVKVTFKR